MKPVNQRVNCGQALARLLNHFVKAGRIAVSTDMSLNKLQQVLLFWRKSAFHLETSFTVNVFWRTTDSGFAATVFAGWARVLRMGHLIK